MALLLSNHIPLDVYGLWCIRPELLPSGLTHLSLRTGQRMIEPNLFPPSLVFLDCRQEALPVLETVHSQRAVPVLPQLLPSSLRQLHDHYAHYLVSFHKVC
jgi:hypothetical protein